MNSSQIPKEKLLNALQKLLAHEGENVPPDSAREALRPFIQSETSSAGEGVEKLEAFLRDHRAQRNS